MNPGYQLAFVDLDDTLLAPDKTVSPENLRALDRLRSAGTQLVLASGRHHRNIARFREFGDLGWLLSSQGSVVRHHQTDEMLLETTLAPEHVAELCRRGRDLGMSLIAYHREGAYIDRATPWTDLYAQLAGWTPQLVDFAQLPPDGFQKILWSEDPARITTLAPTLRRETRGWAHSVITNPELLEFIAATANKAAGAQALSERLGIPTDKTLAFGDGNNDVELLRWAGFSVAMRHGRESAHRAARCVSPAGPPETAFARAVDLALAS